MSSNTDEKLDEPSARLRIRPLRAGDDGPVRDIFAGMSLASVSGRDVGIARWVRDIIDPQRADVGVSVVDKFHGRGIGRALLETLARDAENWRDQVLHAQPLSTRQSCAGARHKAGGSMRKQGAAA